MRHTSRSVAGAFATSAVIATAIATIMAPSAQAAAESPSSGGVGVVSCQTGSVPNTSANCGETMVNQFYHGGTADTFNGTTTTEGVMTGTPKVYLVFYGSQWGTETTNASGDDTFSNDPAGEAPVLQELFKGIGTGNETWSGTVTQYCQGIANGATDCSSSDAHAAYPTGGALAGVWYDNAVAAPNEQPGQGISRDSIAAAKHFGNTTAASNANVNYFIVFPTGTHPDQFDTSTGPNICAYHDYNGDALWNGKWTTDANGNTVMESGPVASPYGNVVYTDFPYVPDAENGKGKYVNCGMAIDNPAVDGVTEAAGHEFDEAVSDPFPHATSINNNTITSGGWDAGTEGQEIGDECFLDDQDVTFSTGTFAMQSNYANDANGSGKTGACEFTHPVETASGEYVNFASTPANQHSTAGDKVNVQTTATDSVAGQAVTYSATGLPKGLQIGASTDTISGTLTAAAATENAAQVNVVAKDANGSFDAVSFYWSVAPDNLGNSSSVDVYAPGYTTYYYGEQSDGSAYAVDYNSLKLTYAAYGLPQGMSLSPDGVYSGVPAAPGSYSVTVVATDTSGAQNSATYTLTVEPRNG